MLKKLLSLQRMHFGLTDFLGTGAHVTRSTNGHTRQQLRIGPCAIAEIFCLEVSGRELIEFSF